MHFKSWSINYDSKETVFRICQVNPIVVPIVEVSRRDELKCLWSRVTMIKIPLLVLSGIDWHDFEKIRGV